MSGLGVGLNQSLEHFEQLRLVKQDDEMRYWRLTARVDGSKEQNYQSIMSDLNAATAAVMNEVADPDVTYSISGGVPLAAKTQQPLLTDLAESYVTAMVLISATLAIVLRSVIGGLLATFPSVFPALVVFGVMGAMDWQVEIGGVMTASAVLGISVDDSLHLIMSFRESFSKHNNRQQAVVDGLRKYAPAMLQTTLVCGLGMFVFVLSPFVPIQRFAWLMLSLLSIALVADLVLLPATLYSPLGRFFLPKHR